jgi:hypothetical protein
MKTWEISGETGVFGYLDQHFGESRFMDFRTDSLIAAGWMYDWWLW